MKREVGVLIIVFFIVLSASFVLAQDTSSNAENAPECEDNPYEPTCYCEDDEVRQRVACPDGEVCTADVRFRCVEVEDEVENEREDDSDEYRMRERTETRVIDADGVERRVRVEREIKEEDGERIIIIKRKIVTSDGNEEEIELKVRQRTGTQEHDVLEMKRKMHSRNETREIESEVELETETEGNVTRIRARLSNGRNAEIKFMPEAASERALERLRTHNYTIEIREREHNNVPRVVYHIEADKTGRFLGVLNMRTRVETEVDAETGEVITYSKPWWAFLVAGEDGPEDGVDEDMPSDNSTSVDLNDSDEDVVDANTST